MKFNPDVAYLAPLLSPVTFPFVRLTWHRLQEHVVYSPQFSWRKSYCSISATKATVGVGVPRVGVISHLSIAGQQNLCHKVISFLFFCLFFVEEERWTIRVKVPLHKKWSFPLKIYSVNVTKSAVSWGFDHIYWRNP